MSSLFNHVFIPLVILLIFSKELRLDTRMVLALSFFALLPDVDAVFIPHRAVLHNVFVLIIPSLLFILVKSKRKIAGIIGFYLVSHLILDMFDGGIFLLYPFYNSVFFAHAELLFTQNSLIPVLDYGISTHIMNMGKGEPAISSENIGVAALLAVLVLILAIWKASGKNEQM